MKIKRFKQLCRWLKIKPYNSDMRGKCYYFKGLGYVWRVNCLGMFQRGDKIKDFDRWALCKTEEIVLNNDTQKLKDFIFFASLPMIEDD